MSIEDQKEYLNQIPLSPEEKKAISDLNAIKKFNKGTILLKEGERPTKSFYVLKGCVRQYHIKDGEEKTSYFFTEEFTVFPSVVGIDDKPSKYYLECLEDCTLTVVSIDQQTDMYKRFPRFEAMCRVATELELSNSLEMYATFIASSPEERYLNILESRPDLLNRVPQYQLASYLGMKPESLSRIRKRLATK